VNGARSGGRRLRVAVNLLWLVPGVVGGTEGYATSLLRELARRDEVDGVLVVVPGFHAAHPDLSERFRTVTAPLPPGRRVVRRVALETTWLGQTLRRWSPDVVHHLGGTALLRAPAPAVVTIHDLQYQHYPQYFSAAKKLYLGAVTPRTVRVAAHLTTVSEYSRRDICARLGVREHDVTVVHPWLPPATAGPPTAATPGPDADTDPAPDTALPERYVLYPAATYPHKNHLVLVDALARLGAEGDDVHLVLTGAAGAGVWGSASSSLQQVRTAVGQAGLGSRVHELSWLPRARYEQVLRGALALVFPSVFEGYGLPVAEALAAGTPVLAGDAASLPEIIGRGPSAGGVLLPPHDAAAWAEAIHRLSTDPDERKRLRENGYRRYTALRATDPAETLLRVYGQVARTAA